jgi:hypothetical protein
MAKIYYKDLTNKDLYVTTSYSVDVAQGDEVIFMIFGNISIAVVELIFLNAPNGTGTVYTSLDSYSKIRTALLNSNDAGITWTKWAAGDMTAITTDKIASAHAPTAMKFTNSSSGAYTIRYNFRGLYGTK